ncbi:MAG: hypothetical protein EBT21_07585, partial [Actinobacteria bacterium]|nr:hypothetical protein [Actinomycetota bacterium]
MARFVIGAVLAPVVFSFFSFAIGAVRQAFALPACTLNTHYTRTLTSGSLPIVYRFTSDCTWTVPSGAGKGDIMVLGGGGG